jgi:hypothetical protein
MMSSPSLVIVLAEDKRHQNFAWHFLKGLGYGAHQVRNEPLPAGRGSGEQAVRQRYLTSVLALRERASRAATALVVVIDADKSSVGDRQRELAEELRSQALQERQASERIAHLIPKRHIETWVLCLREGQPVSEEQDCKSAISDGDVKPAAEEFYKSMRSGAGPPAYFVPSLCDGLVEALRIPPR